MLSWNVNFSIYLSISSMILLYWTHAYIIEIDQLSIMLPYRRRYHVQITQSAISRYVGNFFRHHAERNRIANDRVMGVNRPIYIIHYLDTLLYRYGFSSIMWSAWLSHTLIFRCGRRRFRIASATFAKPKTIHASDYRGVSVRSSWFFSV